MKKYILGLIASAAIALPACDTLDVDPTGYYSENVAYASVDNLDMTVKNFYGMFHAFADIETGKGLTSITDGATDLLKGSWYNVDGGAFNKMFFQDNYITVTGGDFRSNWSSMYNYIRLLNQFLWDYERGMIKLPESDVKARIAEARFLRALAYQELIQRHGGVILRLVDGGVDAHNKHNKARSTEAESWDFVINEYTEIADMLPTEWPSADAGRITKGAALGFKARAALYAKRWDDAIAASDELFALNKYSLMPGSTAAQYELIFTTPNNSELIQPVYFQVGNKQHSWNTWVGPLSESILVVNQESGAAITPTEEYVSQFEISVNGNWEAFDWDNLASYGNKPFDNRDPRFYYSILYPGATWKGRTIEIWDGGADEGMTYSALPKDDNVHKTTTGYLIRKFLTSKEYNYTNKLSDQLWPEMRLAEIYLIRSEAYARKGEWAKAYTDLNAIRARVGLSAKAAASDWDGYLADLQKERICELGLEGHRYFDLVRWDKTQEVLNGTRAHGIHTIKAADGTLSYEVIEVDLADRKFPKKYSICPIPYAEVQNNILCEQNDLWK
ncbi:MAG: RagB/SusD family nutrient uptake outer membrane protein [Muribaculaceae bacterium]|nr:RagB/SusD family nutrient uptake outer membrane protein [Muribaculaceae bacterium]